MMPAEMVPGRCGSTAGWARHQRAEEKPCDACARAKSEYDKRRRGIGDTRLRQRLSARAQARAESRLRALYPDVYAALYREAKREILAEETP